MIITAIYFLGLTAYSQTVGDIPIKDIETTYIQIVGATKQFSTKLLVLIDYGQKAQTDNDKMIKDENGKDVVFNSMIDALNFFYDSGYEFVDSYVVTSGTQIGYNYLLKKKLTN